MPMYEVTAELQMVLALGHALRTGEMVWPNAACDQKNVICEVGNFMKGSFLILFYRR